MKQIWRSGHFNALKDQWEPSVNQTIITLGNDNEGKKKTLENIRKKIIFQEFSVKIHNQAIHTEKQYIYGYIYSICSLLIETKQKCRKLQHVNAYFTNII